MKLRYNIGVLIDMVEGGVYPCGVYRIAFSQAVLLFCTQGYVVENKIVLNNKKLRMVNKRGIFSRGRQPGRRGSFVGLFSGFQRR